MFHDYYLETETEQGAIDVLREAGFLGGMGNPPPAHTAVDHIGLWYERVGGTDEEPEMQQVGGWHFNVRSADPIEWPDGVTAHEPATPWRVWG